MTRFFFKFHEFLEFQEFQEFMEFASDDSASPPKYLKIVEKTGKSVLYFCRVQSVQTAVCDSMGFITFSSHFLYFIHKIVKILPVLNENHHDQSIMTHS
jgi:hypothetical protein